MGPSAYRSEASTPEHNNLSTSRLNSSGPQLISNRSFSIYGPSSLCTRIAADAEFNAEIQVSATCLVSVENCQSSADTSQANLGSASVCETTADVRMKTALKIGFSLRACIIWCIMATGCLSAQFR